MTWRTTPTLSWLDPANWKPASQDGYSEAVPHLERIPCGQDVALFPSSAFRVKLPEFPVHVGALVVDQVTDRSL